MTSGPPYPRHDHDSRPGRRTTPAGTAHEYGEFAKARALAEQETLILRGRAVRTIAYQAVDAEDCRRLLSMLGLDDDVR